MLFSRTAKTKQADVNAALRDLEAQVAAMDRSQAVIAAQGAAQVWEAF